MIKRDVPISVVRTVVPWLVALAGGRAAEWLGLTDEQLTTGATLLVGAAWYLMVRVLEQWWPGAGWLLGAAGPPAYARGGRHEAGRDDVGVSRPAVAAALAVGAVVCLVVVTASAAAAHRPPRPAPLWVGVTQARLCGGVLEVHHRLERSVSGVWEVVPDAPDAGVQLHRGGGRWETVPLAWRSEGYVGAAAGGPWDLVRVVVEADGAVVASSGLVPAGCAA